MRPYRFCLFTYNLEAVILSLLRTLRFDYAYNKVQLYSCLETQKKRHGNSFFIIKVTDPTQIQCTVPSGALSRGRFFFENGIAPCANKVGRSNIYFFMKKILEAEFSLNKDLCEICFDKVIEREGVRFSRGTFKQGRGSVRTMSEMREKLEYCSGILQAVRNTGKNDILPPVPVVIDQGGVILRLGDGRHRIAAHQVLGKPIKVRISHVHRSYLDRYDDVPGIMRYLTSCFDKIEKV